MHPLLLALTHAPPGAGGQVYGFGKSEEFLGEFMKEGGPAPIIASKFAPQPWRLTAQSVPTACKASLKRLQLDRMALYMIHW